MSKDFSPTFSHQIYRLSGRLHYEGWENLTSKLFFFATDQTHLSLLGNFYDQMDGVAMGSPLAPVLAKEIFL